METYLALLRAINVGRHQQVPMSDLRDLLAQLGCVETRSLLQSGNLVFRSGARTGASLERRIEAQAARRLNLRTDFFVRTAEEWEALVARNPFRDEAERDPGHLVVLFLKEAPAVRDVKTLQAAITGPELVHARGKQVYIVYPNGIARSRVSHPLIEKKLCTRGTGRNWNTVLKLAALAETLLSPRTGAA